jgi:hypothetical protein
VITHLTDAQPTNIESTPPSAEESPSLVSQAFSELREEQKTKQSEIPPKKQHKRNLTLKQRKFAEEYLRNGGNGTRAAIDAGYSPSYFVAANQATENLKKAEICKVIEAKTAQIYTEESLKRELSSLIQDTDSEAIKVRGIELAMRNLAMLTDNIRQENVTTDLDELAEQASKTLARLLPQKSETLGPVQSELNSQGESK